MVAGADALRRNLLATCVSSMPRTLMKTPTTQWHEGCFAVPVE